jgi:hypothetical protein
MNHTGIIRDRITQACPNYREKFDIWDGPGYYEDQRDLLIRFSNLNMDIPQFEIETVNTIEATELVVNFTTPTEYNPKILFYEPVPFEFLHTNETKP